MAEPEITQGQRVYLPSLEGVRGYAFLLVFFAHYYAIPGASVHVNHWLIPFLLLKRIAWLGVPIFFALSGYLIGGILFDTRNREGFFRVFYARRFLRVFPVYYLTLLGVACFDSIRGIHLNFNFWADFLYIQNLMPGYVGNYDAAPLSQTSHLWSMAVEEQFYLLWPIVVWFCPDKRTLIKATCILIGLCCLVRCSAYWIHLSPEYSYVTTPTRVDAILLGVLLALIRHDTIYKRLEPYAKYAAFAGVAIMVVIAARVPLELPYTYALAAFEIPLVNLTSAAIIVSVLEEGSFLRNICSLRWICWFGSMSYALYIFHFLYIEWFLTSFSQSLAVHMPTSPAYVLAAIVAFCLTLLLAVLSYRLIEGPAMHLKKRIKYGPVRNQEVSIAVTEPIFSRPDN